MHKLAIHVLQKRLQIQGSAAFFLAANNKAQGSGESSIFSCHLASKRLQSLIETTIFTFHGKVAKWS